MVSGINNGNEISVDTVLLSGSLTPCPCIKRDTYGPRIVSG